jgi:SOS-response transcriptional repressor LexA
VTRPKTTDESNEKSLRLRSMYGSPDLGMRISKLLKERGIKQSTVAPDLRVSTGQVSKLLNDKVDFTLGVFLYFMHRLKERPSAFLGEKNAPTVELVQLLRKLIQIATPIVEPAGSRTVSEETRLVPLLRVAATPDNETYDDDPEPRLYALPRDYNKPETSAFEVVGDSMSGDSIISGDIVLTRPAATIQECEGEIVVCAVHGYRHLKRFHRRRGKVQLESTAPERKVWELNQSERASFTVIGIVINQTRRIAR